jgi:mycofactocin precursor
MEHVETQREGASPVGEKADDEPSVPLTPSTRDADLVESELLIEEISIDGMCGVY